MARTFGSTTERRKGYKAGGVITASAPAAPAAPVLGAITVVSGTIKRVAITTFPADANYLTREVSLNGGAYVSAGATLAIGTTYFDVDVGSATSWSFRSKAGNSGGESAYSSIVSGALGAPSITHTGSGFGTKASLTPLFSRLFDTTTQGQLATAIGYKQQNTTTVPEAYVDMTDGLLPGQGCLRWDTGTGYDNANGGYNAFGHVYVDGLAEQQLFVTVHARAYRTQGSGTRTAMQWKNIRETGTAEYDGPPKYWGSLWLPSDMQTLPYSSLGCTEESGTDHGTDDVGVSSSYKTRWAAAVAAGGWFLQEKWSKLNTIGQSNGSVNMAICGADVQIPGFYGTTFASRTTNKLLNFASLIPGLDGFEPGDQYTFKFAEHIIDNTPQRIVLGNASTWAACTDKIYLFPTAWSDTSVTAQMRKCPWASTGTTVYSYVVNASNVASTGVARTAI